LAIYSLNHSTVGRKTHAPRTAGYHVRYITREAAATKVLGERMPTDPFAARAWMDEQEQHDRVNARVIDKLIVALPLELTHDQRAELVHAFAESMTEGRTPWLAAIHDGPSDADNPHAHILLRDRDIETGRRVMHLSEKGSTERLRLAWEEHSNDALERAGLDVRVDRRTLAAQGIEREAEIHIGPAAQIMTELGERPESKPMTIVHLIAGERTTTTIDYPSIDGGRTRVEENEERRARNRERELALTDPELDWTDRGGMVAQQRSASEWAKAVNDNPANLPTADRLSVEWSRAVAPEPERAAPQAEMSDRRAARADAEARREKTDAVAETWERGMSEVTRAQLDRGERGDRDLDR
jgi:hypothetical protein